MAGVINVDGFVAVRGAGVTIASGSITITAGGIVTVSAESGVTDTLDTILLDSTVSALFATQHYTSIYLLAATGHTITLTDDHASHSPTWMAFGSGANATITESHGVQLFYVGGRWTDSQGTPQLEGGIVDLNTAQTLNLKTFTSITLRGVPSGYTGSQEVHDQVGVQTTDATATNLITVAVAEGESIILRCSIIAHKSDYTEGLGGTLEIKARRASGGNVTIIGTVSSTIEEDSAGSPTATADVDTGTQTVRIRIAGIAATTWTWVGSYTYHKVLTNS